MAKWIRIGLRNRSPSFWIIVLMLAYLAVISQWNDIFQPARSVIVRDTTEKLEDFSTGRTYRELKESFEFAVLSAGVYPKKEDSEAQCDLDSLSSNWEPINPSVFRDLPEIPADAKDWYGNFTDGLEFVVYYKKELDAQGRQLVAVVFRGTDGGLSDSWSNLHWITNWVPFTFDQYDLVRTIVPKLVNRIQDFEGFNGNKVRIVAAGHSLGGGLAHQAAYAVDGIETVYAFDSSSVTGFYDVDKADRDPRAQKMRIYRIYERGEILAYLRRIMAQVYPVVADSPKIVEVRFNFEGMNDNSIALHNMESLACNLQGLAFVPSETVEDMIETRQARLPDRNRRSVAVGSPGNRGVK